MEQTKDETYIPSEIICKLQMFHESLEKIEEILQPLTTANINSSDLKLTPLDRARLNLTSGYALNSLFWMYLTTLGENPKEHGIKTELERYKSFMQSVKELTDKDKAPVLNKEAAKRFVRNALWEPKEKDGTASESQRFASGKVENGEQKRPNQSRYGNTKKRRN